MNPETVRLISLKDIPPKFREIFGALYERIEEIERLARDNETTASEAWGTARINENEVIDLYKRIEKLEQIVNETRSSLNLGVVF